MSGLRYQAVVRWSRTFRADPGTTGRDRRKQFGFRFEPLTTRPTGRDSGPVPSRSNRLAGPTLQAFGIGILIAWGIATPLFAQSPGSDLGGVDARTEKTQQTEPTSPPSEPADGRSASEKSLSETAPPDDPVSSEIASEQGLSEQGLSEQGSGDGVSGERDRSAPSAANEINSSPRPEYPERFPDGRTARVIAFFDSQMSRLVPNDYRPIELERLRRAIDELSQSRVPVERDALVAARYTAVYDEGVLSGSGEFRFAAGDSGAANAAGRKRPNVRSRTGVDTLADDVGTVDAFLRPLGRCNLALRSILSNDSVRSDTPRLTNDAEGRLVAWPGGESIGFRWTLASVPVDGARQVTMELPAAPIGSLQIRVPADVRLTSPDCPMRRVGGSRLGIGASTDSIGSGAARTGAAASRSGVDGSSVEPAVSSETAASAPARSVAASPGQTYRIDVGGAERLRLVFTRRRVRPASLVMRSLGLSYLIDASGISWQQTMTVQSDEASLLADLRVHHGDLQTILVDGVACRFSVTGGGDDHRDDVDAVRVELPSFIRETDFDTLQIELRGTAGYAGVTGDRIDGDDGGDVEPKGSELSGTGAPETRSRRLPFGAFARRRVIAAFSRATAELNVAPTRDVYDWQLPDSWTLGEWHTTAPASSESLSAAASPSGAPSSGILSTDSVAGSASTPDSSGPQATSSSTTVRRIVASGPAVAAFLGPMESTSGRQTRWSAIRSSPHRRLAACAAFLRLTADRDRVACDARISLTVAPDAVRPVRFLVQPSWSITSVRFTRSGRSLETPILREEDGRFAVLPQPTQSGPRRVLVLWPQQDDLRIKADGSSTLDLVISGDRRVRPLRRSRSRIEIPATWFVRAVAASHALEAAIVRPPELRWADTTDLAADGLSWEQVSPTDRDFIDAPADRVQVFRPAALRTPKLALVEPNRLLDARLRTFLDRSGGDLVESLVVEFDADTSGTESIEIRSGRSDVYGPYLWTLRRLEDASATILPDARITLTQLGGLDIYTIDLSGQGIEGGVLIGHRRFDVGDAIEADSADASLRPGLSGTASAAEPGVKPDSGAGTAGAKDRFGDGSWALSVVLPTLGSVRDHQSEVHLDVSIVPVGLARGVTSVAVSATSPLAARNPLDAAETSSTVGASWAAGRRQVGDGRSWRSSGTEPAFGRRVLRYDSGEQPTLRLAVTAPADRLPLVWEESVEVTAAASGVDRIRARYQLSADSDVTISFPVQCVLTRVQVDGLEVADAAVTVGSVRVPGRVDQTITLDWIRNRSYRRFISRCVIPQIEISGVVFKSRVGVRAAADTFIPAILYAAKLGDDSSSLAAGAKSDGAVTDSRMRGRPSGDEAEAPDVTDPSQAILFRGRGKAPAWMATGMGRSVRLVPRNLAIGTGMLFALVWFAACWAVARRFPTVGVGVAGIATFAAVYWPDGSVAIMGWAGVPAVTAFMLAATERAATERAGAGKQKQSLPNDPQHLPGRGRTAVPESNASRDEGGRLSGVGQRPRRPVRSQAGGTGPLSLILGVAVALAPLDSAASPQPGLAPPELTQSGARSSTGSPPVGFGASGLNPSLRGTTRRPADEAAGRIDLLVPVDADGNSAGKIVYLPQSTVETLFRPSDRRGAVDAAIETAAHRIGIQSDSPETPEIICDYAVRTPVETDLVRLPIDPAHVSRIELVSAESERLVGHFAGAADSGGGVVCPVPVSNRFRFRVRLNRTAVVTDDSYRLELSIPPTNRSSLLVQSPLGVDGVRVEGASGRVRQSTLLRRVEADLGPVRSVEVTYRARRTRADKVEPLRPVYWVHVGDGRVVCECEVQPQTDGPLQEVQLVLIADRVPNEISAGWEITDEQSLSADRWLITFRRTGGPAEALRFAWETDFDALPVLGSDGTSNPVGNAAPRDAVDVELPARDPAVPSDAVRYVLPKVIAPATRETDNAWIAVNSDSGFRVRLEADVPTEPLAPEQLRERWQGFQQRTPDRAFVAMRRFPDLLVTPTRQQTPSLEGKQFLTVDDQEIRLRFEATLTPGAGMVSRHAMRYPAGLMLLSMELGGVGATAAPSVRPPPGDGGTEDDDNVKGGTTFAAGVGQAVSVPQRLGGAKEVHFTLPPQRTDGTDSPASRDRTAAPFRIVAVFAMPIPVAGRFDLPFVRVTGVENPRGSYLLSRTSGVSVGLPRSLEAPRPVGMARGTMDHSAWTNVAGTPPTIPVLHWAASTTGLIAESDPAPRLATEGDLRQNCSADGWVPVQIRTRPRRGMFAVTQLTRLRWDSGRWSFSTTLKLPSGELPDDIDVRIPTRWCDQIDVQGVDRWSRQPATDGGHQMVRIDTSRLVGPSPTVTLTGLLEATDQTRLTAPRVDVLGGGKRSRYLWLPRRLGEEAIEWRLSSVDEMLEPDPQIADLVDTPDAFLLRIDSPSWVAELEPSTADAEALSVQVADLQVFRGQSDALLLSRWDLTPGAAEQIDVSIPRDAVVLGAWVAGHLVATTPDSDLDLATPHSADRPVEPSRRAPGAGSPENRISSRIAARAPSPSRFVLRLPVAYMRLPQSIEVLFRLPLGYRDNTNYLPRIRQVAPHPIWVTVLDSRVPADSRVDVASRQRRLHSLGTAVAALMEQSSNLLADRPSDETAQWILPWMARYREILSAAGRSGLLSSQDVTVGRDSPTNSDVQETAATRLDGVNATDPSEVDWVKLTERIRRQTGRFTFDAAGAVASPFSLFRRQLYYPTSVERLAAGQRPPPLVRGAGSTESLGRLLQNALVLVVAVTFPLMLFPYRHVLRPVCEVPSFWLLLLGLCSLVVSPLPVSLAILLAALALPIGSQRGRRPVRSLLRKRLPRRT